MRPKFWIWLFIFTAPLATQGCFAPLAALGSSGTTAATSAGTAVVTVAVANPSTAASLASSAVTGKSPLEHAASAATKKECHFWNALGSKPICEEIPIPNFTDYSTPLPGPDDLVAIPTKPKN
ncbi:hypothetical protein [Polynucleobacter asymbioticus]|uniref:Lipoprotein n=1 Tax=Polynucleobacter asymbioticus (strain DSM 18221 / CIP 109841 / QLW-P1DMWA-1) TaxID=312153 RepID=A4SY04_POLAQ|nr:hypothetical protein [Polynucleobacter asymbioticus]ABP34368.1 hypothetical protein Pnuc_1152 [Polynucleobacter asymbioticus QLW-P1DMWA-1]